MPNLNKALLIGHLGRDPEIKYLPDGNSVANFSIATSEKYKDKEPKTEWHRIVAFGKLAEICSQYLHKGSLVYVEGKIQTRSWEDKDGNKKYVTEIIAHSMQMLGGKQSDNSGNGASGNPGHVESDDVPS